MEKRFVIVEEAGLHARPATIVVNAASKYQCDLFLEYQGRKVNMKSIMGVMSLGIRQGSEIVISAEGEDAELALTGIENVLKEQNLI